MPAEAGMIPLPCSCSTRRGGCATHARPSSLSARSTRTVPANGQIIWVRHARLTRSAASDRVLAARMCAGTFFEIPARTPPVLRLLGGAYGPQDHPSPAFSVAYAPLRDRKPSRPQPFIFKHRDLHGLFLSARQPAPSAPPVGFAATGNRYLWYSERLRRARVKAPRRQGLDSAAAAG